MMMVASLTSTNHNQAYSKDILHSSRDIRRYEKKVVRYVNRHEKEDYSKVGHLTIYYCNYTGELVSDSLLSNSLLSNIEMCFGLFPRKRFLMGETIFYPKEKNYVVTYTHWYKTRGISHLNEKINEDEKLLLEFYKKYDIRYCFNMGREDQWSGDNILIDKNGQAYYYDYRKDHIDFGPLYVYVDRLLKRWIEIEEILSDTVVQ